MKLLVRPDAGIAPILTAIQQARKTIDVLMFRLDRDEITRALEAAVEKGVAVRALIAHTNHGGEKARHRDHPIAYRAREGCEGVRWHGRRRRLLNEPHVVGGTTFA